MHSAIVVLDTIDLARVSPLGPGGRLYGSFCMGTRVAPAENMGAVSMGKNRTWVSNFDVEVHCQASQVYTETTSNTTLHKHRGQPNITRNTSNKPK
jgi:hypothetical protein